MNFIIALLLIGLLSARELLRGYYGPDSRLPKWIRWLNYGTLLALAAFLVMIGWQVFSFVAEAGL